MVPAPKAVGRSRRGTRSAIPDSLKVRWWREVGSLSCLASQNRFSVWTWQLAVESGKSRVATASSWPRRLTELSWSWENVFVEAYRWQTAASDGRSASVKLRVAAFGSAENISSRSRAIEL